MRRRRRRMRRRRYHTSSRASRRTRRNLLLGGTAVVVVVGILFLVPPIRKGILSFSPIKSIQGLWQSWIDPDKKAILEAASASDAKLNSLTDTILPSNGLSFPTHSTSNESVAAPTQRLLSMRPRYALDMTLSETANQITVSQQIYFSNTHSEPLQDIALLWPVAEDALSVDSIILNEQNVTSLMQSGQGNLYTIPLTEPLAPEQDGRMTLLYTITLPESKTVPGTNGRSRAIANCMPLLAPYNGEWVEDAASRFGNLAEFLVTIHVPKNVEFDIAASGQSVEVAQANDNMNTLQYELKRMPAYALAIGSSMRSRHVPEENSALNIYVYHTSQANTWAENAESLLTYMRDTFGDYANAIHVFEMDLEEDSLQIGDLIFLNQNTVDEQRRNADRILAPHMAHIWLNSSAEQNPALAELFARYAAQRYLYPDEFDSLMRQSVDPDFLNADLIGAQQEASASGDAPIDLASLSGENTEPIASASDASSSQSNIDQDVASLIAIRAQIGAESFDTALKTYIQNHGEKPFTEYFDESVHNDIDILMQIYMNS